jgi:uncharacterized membrane-anchored protein
MKTQRGFSIVWVLVILLIVGFIIWKREPWVRTFPNQQECETLTGKDCILGICDLPQTFF